MILRCGSNKRPTSGSPSLSSSPGVAVVGGVTAEVKVDEPVEQFSRRPVERLNGRSDRNFQRCRPGAGPFCADVFSSVIGPAVRHRSRPGVRMEEPDYEMLGSVST